MREMHRESLNPYQDCPLGKAGCSQFGREPLVELSCNEESISVWRCDSCGHGVTRPAMPDVSTLYSDRESQDFQQQDGQIASLIKRSSFNRQARQILRLAEFTGGQVIDYGCGSGVLSSAIARNVPAGSEVTALDFHRSPPDMLEGADYHAFDNAVHLHGSADLVTCFHVLEHDDDSAAFLRRIIAFLKPGGKLVLEVPHVDCFWSDAFGRNWDNWYLPYHRVHFSRASLRGLLQGAGLEIMKEQEPSIPSMGRSLARKFDAANSLPFVLASAVLFPVQWGVEKATARPSALRVIARKPV